MKKLVWFETKEISDNSLQFINDMIGYPLVSRNVKTGEVDPEGRLTTKWADSTQKEDSNKWGYARVPQHIWDMFPGKEEEYNTLYPHTQE